MCWLTSLFRRTVDIPSASDIVPTNNITCVGDKVEISLNNLNIPFTKPPKVWIPPIPDTNSMDPSFDFGHNNILIAGVDEDNQRILVDFLKVGDVAVYQNPQLYAIHRIVRIEFDDVGRKFTFRGDNNASDDPYPVRDEHIQWICIGTIF